MNGFSKTLLLANSAISTTACVSKIIDSSNTIINKAAVEESSSYSYGKDYYFTKIKLVPFDPRASQLWSRISREFYFKNDCLIFINGYRDITIPILPASVTDWDEDSKILHIVGKSIKMNQQVSTNGSFRKVQE